MTADWTVLREPIEGVVLREVRNVPNGKGWVTELWRRDWGLDELDIDQVFQVTLVPGAISAWHVHHETTDRLFVTRGLVRIVLYDARPDSATEGRLNELHLGEVRPGLVVVPCGVWHGVQNIGPDTAVVTNIVDHAYAYDDPDHWRLPADAPDIPYTFDH